MAGFPRWLMGKEAACFCRRCKRHGFDPWVRKIPWRMKWQSTPVFLPGKSHGQRSLMGYDPHPSPWGPKELDATKHSHTHSTLLGEMGQVKLIDLVSQVRQKWQKINKVKLSILGWYSPDSEKYAPCLRLLFIDTQFMGFLVISIRVFKWNNICIVL